jgi:fructoselysine-6-P-deglycase FrlB-like protein
VVSHVAEEIASQPRCWEQAAALAREVGDDLPPSGARVAVVGCGTSRNVAQVYASLREGAGEGETDAFAASQFPADRAYDHLVFISRTGTTTEVLDAMGRVRSGVACTAITAQPTTPIAAAGTASIALDFADEQAVVATRFATSVIVLLRAQLGMPTAPLIAECEEALVAEMPEEALDATQYTFLGLGWAEGVAHEAALKLRESAQVWAESYAAMEYRHGPISVAGPGSWVWALGDAAPGMEQEVRATGAQFVTSGRDPLAELVRAQRLAVGLAESRGLDADSPRHLAHSVVLGRS